VDVKFARDVLVLDEENFEILNKNIENQEKI
jgi:hypothetical protein